jgi:entericidin B
MVKKLVTILGILSVTFAVTACNTVRGMGQDVQSGGEKMQNKATEVQQGH